MFRFISALFCVLQNEQFQHYGVQFNFMNWLLTVTACAYALNTGLVTANTKWQS